MNANKDNSGKNVRRLNRADQGKRMRTKVDAILLEALESGKPIDVTPEYWREKNKQLLAMNSKR